MDVSTRAYRPDDLGEVLEVLRASLGESPLLRRSRELFAWKHRHNPFGESVLLVATVGERIAGFRAVMRWDLLHPEGETIRCGRMVDTAIHPDFQRMGLFRRLTMESLEVAGEKGIQLIFNTPNPKSGAGYLKMGWQPVGFVGVMVRPSLRMLRADPSLGDVLPTPQWFVSDATPVRRFSVADRPPRGLRTPRSEAYLRWRFASHPTAAYVQVDVEDAAVIARPNHRSRRRELVVSELLGGSLDEGLSALVRRSRADYMVGWFSRKSPERRAALRHGLVPVPGVKALEMMARPLTDGLVETVADLGAWDLSMGDLELL